jgi:site-specific DNA-methyltransferase (adenine-specific)
MTADSASFPSIGITQGDFCEEVAKLDPETRFDCILTSPDYNLGVTAKRQGHDEYLNWSERWTSLAADRLAPDGSFFLNLGYAPSNPAMPWDVVGVILRQGRLKLQNVIHWVKSTSVIDSSFPMAETGERIRSFGHFKPIGSTRYLNGNHEYIFHFTRSGAVVLDRLAVGVPYQDKTNVRRWAGSGGRDLRCRGDVWFLPYETIQKRDRDRPHPATFPIELAENCIRLRGIERTRSVMDCFMGAGTTAIAADRLGVDFILGFELMQDYIDHAWERIQADRRRRKNPVEDTSSLRMSG